LKIKKIKINSYGNIENKEIYFNDNINIIFGKNESGKSTLLNFIKSIFYGISKNKEGKEISDYEKYKPWNKNEFSGKIKYELDNKEAYEVFRDFNKKNSIVFDERMNDISNNYKIDKKDGNQFFKEQTGVDESTYISSLISVQQEVVLDKASQNVLLQRLANLAGTGDDKVSFAKAIDRLNKRQVEEVGTTRTTDRPINIIQKRMKELEFDFQTAKEVKEQKENLEKNKTEILQIIEEEKEKNNAVNQLNMLTKKQEVEDEKILIKNKIKNENEEKIKKIINEKNQILKNNNQKSKKQQNKNNIIFIISFIIIIILNIIIFFKNELNIILPIILLIELIIFFIKVFIDKKKKKKQNIIIKDKEEKIKLLNAQIEFLEQGVKKIENEIKEEIQLINNNYTKSTNEILKNYSNKIREEIENLDNSIDEELEISNNKIMEYQLKINNIYYEEKIINDKLEQLIIKIEEYEELKEKLNILEEKNKCINMAKEILEKSYEKMKNNITPKFTKKLSEIANEISGGKYKKVILNEEKGLIVELENGEYISAGLLSVGTIDQLYLSLRLSMMDEISEEKMPIILDETFAFYDTERLTNTIKVLAKKTNQIIILTCSNREKEILDKNNINYNWIEF